MWWPIFAIIFAFKGEDDEEVWVRYLRIHWIERLTIWASLILTMVVAFEMLITIDQELPAGTGTSFTVERVDTATKADAVRAIAQASRNLGINVFKIQPSFRDSMKSRVLVAFVGDQKSFQRNGGYDYPSFSTRDQSTKVVSFEEITTQDLRGSYATNADRSHMEQLAKALSRSRIVVDESQSLWSRGFWIAAMIYALGKGGLWAGVVIIAITLVVSTAYSLSRNRKIHAIKAMHGYTSGRILVGELVSLLATLAVGLVTITLVGLPFLWFINNFHQIWRLLRALFIAVAVLTAYLVFLALALGGASTFHDRIPSVLNGEGNELRDGIIAGFAQFIVVAVLFGTISGSLNRISAVQSTSRSLAQWSRISDQYVLRFSINITQEDTLRAAPPLMKVIEDLDSRGKAMLVGYKGDSVFSADGNDNPYEPEGSDSMIVSPNYLDKQPIAGLDGKPVKVVGKDIGAFTLLVPSSYKGDPGALLKEYAEYFKRMCRGDVTRKQKSYSCNPHGVLVRTRSGQDISLFSGTQFMPAEDQQRLSLKNPVVAVTSPSSGLISPMEYLSYTSSDSVLFSDPELLQNKLDHYGISGYFQGIDNAKDSVAYTLSLSRNEQRGDIIAISFGLAAAMMAILVCSAAYCARRRRLSFVQFIHGYGFFRRHGGFLIMQNIGVLLTLMAVGIICSMNKVADLVAGTLLFAGSSLIMAITVSAYESRFRADDIKRP
ncbi:bacteriocin-associated integral membrane family protein [Bifidobacterium apicola]|uniref:bacteriocin-associated integral membrane family protein n=1 Tax=Bifidobacterium apicola TaxID=3230739 RepID=UPI0036F2F323